MQLSALAIKRKISEHELMPSPTPTQQTGRMNMSTYKIFNDFGGTLKSNAKTLAGAKRAASQWASFDGQSIYVEDQSGIWARHFWQSLNRFGWGEWERVN